MHGRGPFPIQLFAPRRRVAAEGDVVFERGAGFSFCAQRGYLLAVLAADCWKISILFGKLDRFPGLSGGLTKFGAYPIHDWLWMQRDFRCHQPKGAVILPFLKRASRDYQKEATWTLSCLKMWTAWKSL